MRRTRSQTIDANNNNDINSIDSNNNENNSNDKIQSIVLEDGIEIIVGDIVFLQCNQLNTPFIVTKING